MKLSSSKIVSFRKIVYRHYREHKRDFPWRKTRDPYAILVSEVMLQQTHVGRVEAFYPRFMRRFPTIHSLARARSGEVLRIWKGLGYNRRALNIHRTAKILNKSGGIVPRTAQELEKLPGVGHYTARAVPAFAFNRSGVFVETNIRTVFLHHFFTKRQKVSDREILALVEQTLDKKNPGKWYQALMDYGAALKLSRVRLNTKSSHYAKQNPFKGSRRELRGALLSLALKGAITKDSLKAVGSTGLRSRRDVTETLRALVSEGFLEKKGYSYHML